GDIRACLTRASVRRRFAMSREDLVPASSAFDFNPLADVSQLPCLPRHIEYAYITRVSVC
ncbi:hypothetical protein BaRGS_00020199, partial [Batillaria attramentaria]